MNRKIEYYSKIITKIATLLMAAIFIFILIFFFFKKQPSKYYEQKIQHMKKTTDQEISFSEIPLTLKYLNEPTGNLECNIIPQSMLKSYPEDGYLSSYEGFIWLDITFDNDPKTYGSDYILQFGIEPILFAEVYKEDVNGWQFYGKTGRIYKRSQMTLPTWVPAVPIHLNDFQSKDSKTHLRVKLVSPVPLQIKVKLLTQNYFLYKYSINSVICFALSGIFFLSAILLLLYGIVYKDKTYTYISISSFFLLLANLDLRGISTCYFWNSFYYPRTSLWLIFFLAGSSLIFFTMAVGQLTQEYSGTVKFKHCIPFNCILLAVTLLILVFTNNPVFNFFFFITVAFITLLILLSFIYVNHIPIKHSGGRLLLIGTILILLIAFRLSLHLFRRSYSFSLYSIVCNDYYCQYDLVNALLLFPVISTLVERTRRYNKVLVARNSTVNKKTKHQTELLEYYGKLISEVEENHSIISNTVKTINETETAEAKENLSVIQRTSSYTEMILKINNLMNSKSVNQDDVIQLLPFFISCKKAVDSLAKPRAIHLSLKADMQDDYTVLTNKELLTFLFTEYLIYLVEYVPRYTNIAISLAVSRLTLSYKVTIDSKTPEELKKDITISQDYKFNLITKAIKLLNGTFDTTIETDKLNLLIKLKLTKLTDPSKATFKNQDHADEKIIDAIEYNMGKLINLSSDNFTIAGHTPVILLIENNLKLLEQISGYLSKKCTILHSTNGLEAWNLLNSLRHTSLPDLIITNIHNPVMEGDELLRKCSSEDDLCTIPFIFLLPHNEGEKKNQLMARGAVNCLIKPFDFQELFFTVYSTLNLKEMYYKETLSRISHAVYSHSDEQIIPAEKKSSQKRTKTQQSLGKPNRTITLTASQSSLFENALLSSRERQIALLISEGKTDKQISEELFISAATVATHNKKIFKKLGVHSRVELMNKVR